MANMNTLFRKGYLLAGVVMAANMFIGNEIKAMKDNTTLTTNINNLDKSINEKLIRKEQIQDKEIFQSMNIPQQKEINTQMGGEKGDQKNQSPLYKLLSWENYFNFFGTLALSGFNNYFKWWDYNPGGYLKLRIGCLGWRTKKFFDIVQLDFNLNLGRGALWLILHIIFRRSLTKAEKIEQNDNKENQENVIKSGINADSWVSFLFKDILRGFVSIPLTFHISNFSISISLDSIIWGGIGKFLDKTEQQPNKENQTDINLGDYAQLQDTSDNEKEEKKEEEK
jgi:hypothetical protein